MLFLVVICWYQRRTCKFSSSLIPILQLLVSNICSEVAVSSLKSPHMMVARRPHTCWQENCPSPTFFWMMIINMYFWISTWRSVLIDLQHQISQNRVSSEKWLFLSVFSHFLPFWPHMLIFQIKILYPGTKLDSGLIYGTIVFRLDLLSSHSCFHLFSVILGLFDCIGWYCGLNFCTQHEVRWTGLWHQIRFSQQFLWELTFFASLNLAKGEIGDGGPLQLKGTPKLSWFSP